jgi:hypothetical protein
MLYREIIAVCSEIHTKPINTLLGQKVEFVNVKPGGTYSDHWALEGLKCILDKGGKRMCIESDTLGYPPVVQFF